LLDVLTDYYRKDTTLTIGLKLPPYVFSTQFEDVIRWISEFTATAGDGKRNPFAFLTCTNTLGSSLMFSDQTESTNRASNLNANQFALPTTIGGLAGDAIHMLSLGNVHTFTQLLRGSLALQNIKIIGVGGVTSPEGVDRMQQAGAQVVGCATLLGRKGVQVFEMLSKGLGQV